MKTTFFVPIFRRLELLFAEELEQGTMLDVSVKIRGSLKSRTKILKQEVGLSHSAALELLARMLGFQDWHECNLVIEGLEAEPTRLPSVSQANNLLSLLVQWPSQAPDAGPADPAHRLAQRELLIHVVIAHAHGHKLAKLLPATLARGLDIAAKLHGAPDWVACVYGVEYWVNLATP